MARWMIDKAPENVPVVKTHSLTTQLAAAKAGIGSLLIVEAQEFNEAVGFAHSDPFYRNKVWHSVEVRPFLKLVDGKAPL